MLKAEICKTDLFWVTLARHADPLYILCEALKLIRKIIPVKQVLPELNSVTSWFRLYGGEMLQANCHIEWNPSFSPKHHQLVLQAKGYKKKKDSCQVTVPLTSSKNNQIFSTQESVKMFLFPDTWASVYSLLPTDGQLGICELMDAHIGFGELEPPKTSSKFFPNFQDCKETGEDYYQIQITQGLTILSESCQKAETHREHQNLKKLLFWIFTHCAM